VFAMIRLLCTLVVVLLAWEQRCDALISNAPRSRHSVAGVQTSSKAVTINRSRCQHGLMILPTGRRTSTTTLNAFPLDAIPDAFNIATFGPQLPWLLMIALPNAGITKKVMGGWATILLFSLVHFFIVAASISSPDGTAPIAEFAGVFDPSGNPLAAMMGMMKYPNFVSEEWSHVLVWDLLVGRFIWLDGLERGIFTSHSVLLTNLIGPPGLLLHYLTCAVLGKGFIPTPAVLTDPTGTAESSTSGGAVFTRTAKGSGNKSKPAFAAYQVVQDVFPRMLTEQGATAIADMCDDSVVWEDVNDKETKKGPEAVRSMLSTRAATIPATLQIDSIADGLLSTGFMWHYKQAGVDGRGLRGTTFVEFNTQGKIVYVREVSEPLFKPGSVVGALLKGVAAEAVKKDPSLAVRPPKPTKRTPASASDLVTYLWEEINGSDVDMYVGVRASVLLIPSSHPLLCTLFSPHSACFPPCSLSLSQSPLVIAIPPCRPHFSPSLAPTSPQPHSSHPIPHTHPPTLLIHLITPLLQPHHPYHCTTTTLHSLHPPTPRSVDLFADDIIYQDFNYPTPFLGKAQVREFIQEFDFPGITFVPERISEGRTACCFTWRVLIAGAPADQATRGISFYETNKEGKVAFIRDIAEPLIKPAPLQRLAAAVNPGLRRFQPVVDVSETKY
jgi:hypothetical protein